MAFSRSGGAQYWGAFAPPVGGAQYFPSVLTAPPTAAAPAPAAAAAPPAAPNTVAPYLTPQDLQNINNERTTFQQQLAAIAKNLSDLQSSTGYQLAQGQKQAASDSENATDNAIARGLFQSSVKDASLYDITAQQQIQANFLKDAFSRALADAQTQQNIISNSWSSFQAAMIAQAVQNAQAVNTAAGAAGFSGPPPDLTAAFGSLPSLTLPTLPGSPPAQNQSGLTQAKPIQGTETPPGLPKYLGVPTTPPQPGATLAQVTNPVSGGTDQLTGQPTATSATPQHDLFLTALKKMQPSPAVPA